VQEVISRFLTWPQLVGTLGSNMFRKLAPDFLTCPLFKTYIEAKRVREVDLRVVTCSQLVGILDKTCSGI